MFKELRLKKYKWKCRIILLSTPHYKNKEYLEAKKIKKLYMLDEIEDSSDEELEYLSD